MNDLLIYFIKANAAIILFYLCYKLLFQRDTFWMLRRTYLLVSVFFSFLYPIVPMEGWLEKQEPIMAAIASIQLEELIITPEGTGRVTVFTLENVLWTLFGCIALLMLVQIFVQLVSILKRRLQGIKAELQGVPVIKMDEEITPFSFFQWIFINPAQHTESETAEILEHELTHVRQWHSVDVIIAQIQKMLCWPNPAAWLIEREIRYNLEFLADNQVLKSGFDPKKYQYHLLSLTYEPANSKLGNQFNVLPIKRRIKMMNSKKTKKTGLLKYALIVPIVLAMLIISAMQNMIASTKTMNDTQETVEIQEPVTGQQTSSGVQIELHEVSGKEYEKGVATAQIQVREASQGATFEVPVVDYGTSETTTQDGETQVLSMVDVPPKFPGGEKAMFEWLNKNINYPVEAQRLNIQGRVVVQFVVNKDGKIMSPKIIKRVDPLLDAEAFRVVNAMPNWIPGRHNGSNVNVRYTLPVQFKVFENKKGTPAKPAGEHVTVGADGEKIFYVVDTPPKFEGGDQAMFTYLSKEINYPAEAQKKKIQGRVLVEFVVKATGEVGDVKVLRGISPELDEEAVRVVSGMPNWIPGQQNGKNVHVSYVLPVQFALK